MTPPAVKLRPHPSRSPRRRQESATLQMRTHVRAEPRWWKLERVIRAQEGRAQWLWAAPRRLRARMTAWSNMPSAGTATLAGGTALLTLLIAGIDHIVIAPLPSPGLVYLPLVAMLAYHWGWRHAALATLAALVCVYYFFISPSLAFKPVTSRALEQLLTPAIVTGFVLALVQLARTRRALAEHEAGRFAALNAVGTALARELDEQRLLGIISRTACELTDAGFAAFTLRPLDELGRPAVPSEGSLFHLAAVVGVTPEQEAIFRRMPLGGEGLLAPIFRHGIPVRVADALEVAGAFHGAQFAPHARGHELAHRQATGSGPGAKDPPHAAGVLYGHPIVRSFLGAPLLDRTGEVRGGLLLGHSQPGHFCAEDEGLLVGLAAQATVALENARLYRAAQTRAQELDAIFESISDGITLVDERGQVMRENAAARRLREEILTSDAASDPLSSLIGASARRALCAESAEADSPLPAPGMPITIADRRGELRHYLVSASPVRADDSEFVAKRNGQAPSAHNLASGAVVVCHDVTEARRLEEERRARAEAAAAERLKDEFVAIAAHELRNPMAAIKGYAQMLTSRSARGKGGALEEWQTEALATIDASTSRLVELTDDLLDVTRLQAGRLELHLAPVDLVALVRRVARRLQVTTPAHTLGVIAEGKGVVACVDVQRMEQVLGNLINNAIKYSPEGGPVTISLRACDDQGMAEISIRDAGIGIPEAEQPHIFARFVRADNAKARGIGGTGLGLYLCRELVERHGGRIRFESVEGQGTTFHFTLPLVRDDRRDNEVAATNQTGHD
jgi:signal transduction histidine kinase